MFRIFSQGWKAYGRLLDTHPLRTKATSAFIIIASADTVRQRLDGSEAWDAKRTLRLAGFYGTVNATWVHYWYAYLDRLLGPAVGVRVVAMKVAMDQLLSMPAFMVVLLTTQTLLSGYDLEHCKLKLRQDLLSTIQ